MVRPLRTRLDLIQDAVNKTPEKGQIRSGKFTEGTAIWVRLFGRVLCVASTVQHSVGKVICKIKTLQSNWIRHLHQLRCWHEDVTSEVSPELEASVPADT